MGRAGEHHTHADIICTMQSVYVTLVKGRVTKCANILCITINSDTYNTGIEIILGLRLCSLVFVYTSECVYTTSFWAPKRGSKQV